MNGACLHENMERLAALVGRAGLSGRCTVDDGGIWPAPPEAPSFVQLFIEVPDVDASIARAQSLGATIIVPKVVLPDGDQMAVLRDPLGMTFGLCLLR